VSHPVHPSHPTTSHRVHVKAKKPRQLPGPFDTRGNKP